MYIATCGKIITSVEPNDIEHMGAVSDAIEGKISYSGNFDVDEERLAFLFIFTLMECFAHRINDLSEIASHEKLTLPIDKYGLTDVTEKDRHLLVCTVGPSWRKGWRSISKDKYVSDEIDVFFISQASTYSVVSK